MYYVFVLVRLIRLCFVLGDVVLKLALLRRGLGELLVAVGLLRGLLLGLLLELGDHVRDEALDLAEDVLWLRTIGVNTNNGAAAKVMNMLKVS